MAEKTTNPEVRFTGFSNNWEERELSTILTERKIMQKISKDAPILAFAAGQGVIDRSERKSNNRDHLTHDQENKIYKLTEYNDIVYNPSNLKYGAIDRNKLGRGVISPIYVTFTTEEEPSFIELLVKSEKFKLRALQYEEGTVVKRQSVKPENLLSLKVNISPSKEEQNKIGKLFEELERLINHHERLYYKLTKVKKAMLIKMFPSNENNCPEIRFTGFKKPWIPKRLNEFSTYHSSTLSVGNALSSGKYKLYDANEVIGYSNENGQPCDYITIIKDGSGVGRVRLLPKQTSFIGTMGAIRAYNSDINFLFCCLLNTNFRKHITGATIPHIYYSSYGEDQHFVPEIEEQNMIGNFFKKMDLLIEFNQKELEKLQNLRKACFEKMTSSKSKKGTSR